MSSYKHHSNNFESQSSSNIQKSLMCPKIIVENFYEQP